jgi:hypothetical protein
VPLWGEKSWGDKKNFASVSGGGGVGGAGNVSTWL